jgi:alpha-galactosidase
MFDAKIWRSALYLTAAVAILVTSGCTRTDEAQLMRDQWVRENLEAKGKLPFSFTYDGKTSDAFLANCSTTAVATPLDDHRTQHELTWLDSRTGLEIRCVEVEYADYPAVEWTAYFRNTGTKETPILENIEGLDATFHRGPEGEFILNGIKGDWCNEASYQPYRLTLDKNFVKKFTPSENVGKSCSGPDGWPYFNLQMPGRGILMAVGWPGQWAGSFARDGADGLRVTASQQLTHLSLRPGEEIRTPLIAMLFWKGDDVVRSQNIWRRWFTADNMPRLNGQTQQPIKQIQVSATEANVAEVDAYLKAGIKPDVCWRDANWYVNSGSPFKGDGSWLNTGTWEPDPARYPHGFKPFSDYVHSHGSQFLLWFEPERVGDPTSWLAKNHPKWLLPCDGTGSIFNEGDPEAWKWLVDHIDTMIKTQGIDWYREDMNGNGPLPAWRRHDADNRQGITENLYIQGHLALWDELRRRNPGLRIDSCASGGRRNDLESMRRAVPLLRSDFQFPNMKGVVEGNQGHTYGLSFWLPFYGTGCYLYDQYSYRSFYVPSFGMDGITEKTAAAQKKIYDECGRISPFMLGDYYPLTPYSLALDHWIAWQFNRPESGDGMVQAFRRKSNPGASQTFHLARLDPAAQYTVTNLDVDGSTTQSGQALMGKGLTVEIKDTPGSAIILYSLKP